MNLLITGNIGAGKSTLSKELLKMGFTQSHRYYAVDKMRWRFSDGSYSGEYYAWSLMFRAGQEEPHGIFEFSGSGRNAPIFKEVIRDSIQDGKRWRVIHCHCHINEIAERVSEKESVPIPYKQWQSQADRLAMVEHAKSHIDARINTGFWLCPELVVRTDKYSPKECAEQVIEWLAGLKGGLKGAGEAIVKAYYGPRLVDFSEEGQAVEAQEEVQAQLSDSPTELAVKKTEGALGVLAVPNNPEKEIIVVANDHIRDTLEQSALIQAVNTRGAPGVSQVVLNPDAHGGYGAPNGSVVVSPTHIYPGPVGTDIKCSMSLIQFDVPESEFMKAGCREALMAEIEKRIPTKEDKTLRRVPKMRKISFNLGRRVVIEGASKGVCEELGIPYEWVERCEDSAHVGHDGTQEALEYRFEALKDQGVLQGFGWQRHQLGSYGGGNHFGDAGVVSVAPGMEEIADRFGLKHGAIGFLSHCGARGFGYNLAKRQFDKFFAKFEEQGKPFPGGDKLLCHAELGTDLAKNYLDDMALGGNFATVNHLLINVLVKEAFEAVFPGVGSKFVYFISHNFARLEEVDGQKAYVHRKGATRAFPGGHPQLKGTIFEDIGHPILLPGDIFSGAAVMVGKSGAEKACYSINHGAGRRVRKSEAAAFLGEIDLEADMKKHRIITNLDEIPIDIAPGVFKNFGQVLDSVREAQLAESVAHIDFLLYMKDEAKGAA